MYFGNACQNAILPTLVRPPLPTVQPSLDMKQFLPFPLDTTTTVNLFPNFSANMIGISRTEQGSPIGTWKTGLSGRRLCVSMDPVQKAVINHTFGVPPPPKRKHVVSCSVCQLRFNSQSQASAHYKGTKHAKKLKALEAPKCKQKASAVTKETTNKDTPKITYPPPIPTCTDRTDNVAGAGILPPSPPVAALSCPGMATGGDGTDTAAMGLRDVPSCTPAVKPTASPSPSPSPSSETETETEEEKAKRLLYCSLCKVAVNSASQLEAHNSGTKHKTMLEARSGSGTIKSFPRPGVKGKLAPPAKSTTGLQNKTFHCEICDVHVNSETQLKQHISSRRHKDRAAGKPPKPKYSPYNKTQRGPSGQPVKIEVRKDLGPSITARMLPNHLQMAVAAAAAATGPSFPLRPGHATTLFHTHALPTSLLRPAPGPMRTSHTPVLFSPY
ncbi:zinc finger protein 385D isoform X2 [Conger conger]|uniref:zinc finger protein 385D isoform X2 n=1 Tax=Conger conger TaxID=82655 RepID=UPI002A59D7F9|nr:zinc finger protein 385D isoform X2 [Conger conger]